MSIGIVIPTFHRVAAVRRLCAAIHPQLGEDDELIVLDDGQDDRVPAMLAEAPRARVIHNPVNLGMVGNWNRCFEVAKSEWVCTVHDDDDFAGDGMATLRQAIGVFASTPGVVVGGALPTADGDPSFRYRFVGPGRWAVLHATTIPSGAAVHRRVFEELGTFKPQFAFSADLELFARYAVAFPTLIIESPPVVTYQLHDSNHQYATWRHPDFIAQLEAIARAVGGYARLERRAVSATRSQHDERLSCQHDV